jgi:hypothetical protein
MQLAFPFGFDSSAPTQFAPKARQFHEFEFRRHPQT